MLMLFIVLIVIMLVNFSWKLWESFQPRSVVVLGQSASQTKTPVFNTRKLKSYQLFGTIEAKQTPDQSSQINAPITRLKLKLRGVYSASDDNLAGAMIEAQNKQQVYRIGQSLPGASGLKLHQIMPDRVIMSRNGKFETLMIEDFGGKVTKTNTQFRNRSTANTKSPSPRSPSSTVDKRNDRNLTKELIKLRSKLSDPQSLNELVSVTPSMKNGQFQGFRLTPGKNRGLFARMGLRRNDLVKSVNGINLDSPASAFSLMEQISTADEINLTIKRGSRDINILFSAQTQ